MIRTKIAFLVAAASALTVMGQGANAAPPNPIGMITVRSSLVLQTHGCHKLCAPGPYGYWHRHRFGSCDPTPFPCIDWGIVFGPRPPVFFKQRRSH
jgi:hypothetical protein